MADETTTTEEQNDQMESNESWRTKRLNVSEEKRKAAEKRAAELEERLDALEQRDKTDVERLTRDLEKMQKKAAEHEARATELEQARARDSKSALVANAAAKLKFHDPELAARIVDLEDIEDAHAAEAAVKLIAKERPYLVQRDDDQTRQRLKRVGVDGQVVEEDANQGMVTEEQQKEQWGKELLGLFQQPGSTEAI